MLVGRGVKAARAVKGKVFLLNREGLQEPGGVSRGSTCVNASGKENGSSEVYITY